MAGLNSYSVAVDLPLVGGTVFVKVPAAAAGGAVTVLSADVINGAATSSTASFYVDVLNMGTALATSVSGTICATIGGTASHWAVGTFQRGSVTAAQASVAAGGYIGIRTVQQTIGTITAPAQCLLTMVQGKTGA